MNRELRMSTLADKISPRVQPVKTKVKTVKAKLVGTASKKTKVKKDEKEN